MADQLIDYGGTLHSFPADFTQADIAAAHEARDILNGHGFACPASIALAAEKGQITIVGNLAYGEPVDQGSGFFVNETSGIAQQRQAAEASYGQIQYADGTFHNRSIGRDFAGMFADFAMRRGIPWP